jgi:hypothetical protein
MSASMPTWTAAVPSDRSVSLRHMIDQQPQHISIADCACVELVDNVVGTRNRSSLPRVRLTPSEFGGTMASASTSLGEASAWIQATDLERRKTPRVRTAPPGLRVEPKWLPEISGYAVQCQSSVERGAVTGHIAGFASSRVHRVGTPACPGREEVRRSESQ